MDQEKSQILADQIIEIAKILQKVDPDYLKESVVAFKDRASFQDSTAVLNPLYSRERSDLAYKQAQALATLEKYRDLLVEIDGLKAKVVEHDINRSKINKLFM